MGCKTFLLGGVMAVALSGAASAQTASDANPTTRPAHHTIVHHYRHHVRHRVLHTAAVHAAATPAERAETNTLNREQLRPAGYAAPSQYEQNRGYQQEPGQNTGLTPTRRIPNGIPFQAATPAGGRADQTSLDQAHPR